jgi:hypothetical protein
MPDYADIWDQHDLAVSALYDVIGPAKSLSTPIVRSADISSRADLVITTSSRLADAAAQNLTAPSAADRERSALRLVAGAAADIAIANDLLQVQAKEPTIVVRKATPAYPDLLADLGPILRPGNELTLPTTRSTSPRLQVEDADEALTQLKLTVTRSFDVIVGDVAEVGQMTISGLIALPIDQVQNAAAVAAQEILNLIADDVGAIVRRAAKLLIQAYDKILKALGQEAASKARQQATQWILMLQTGSVLDGLLERLYEKQRILDDIETHARQVPDALLSDALSTALKEAHAVSERFQQHRRSLEWVLRGLAFLKASLLAIEPWGPLAVTAMYVGTLGYAVYAGGDYVDWFRTDQIEPLNRIPGLRDVVRHTLGGRQTVEVS